jgi:putative endopeptidase
MSGRVQSASHARRWLPVAFLLCAFNAPMFADAALAVGTDSPARSADPSSRPAIGTWGLDLTDRDPGVKPGDNFYMSQNGAWFARTEVGESGPNAAYWRDLRAHSRARVAEILKATAANRSERNTDAARAAVFYRSYMDEKNINARGVRPLKNELEDIRSATDRKKMARLLGRVAGADTNRNVNVFARPLGLGVFGLDIAQDVNQTDRYALYVRQAGLLLPGPEYYLDPKLADVLDAYRAYIEKQLTFVGWPEAATKAKQIVAFETRVARESWTHEQMNDVVKTNNPMSVSELQRFAPGFDWREFFKGAEVPRVGKINIDAKSAFPKIAEIYAATPLDVLRARQAFALVDSNADALTDGVLLENFRFRTKLVNGQGGDSPPPRESRAAVSLGMHLDEIVGSLYAAHDFSEQAKSDVLQMTGELRKALDARLAGLAWMSSATKAEARRKLARMTVHVGYPDHPANHSGLEFSEDDLYGNIRKSDANKWRQRVSQLDGMFDREEWNVTADYPNYNYKASTNTLELPAALLQPPFFDVAGDDAVNYGAIGSLMGSVMVAAFDPQGRHYDADGRVRDWWTPAEVAHFEQEIDRLSHQYSAVEPLPGLHIKGDLLAGESIDDLGGLLIALDAYRSKAGVASKERRDGFSGDQRFFLGRAQMWRAKFGSNFVRNQIATGANAPPFLRVNGPVRNIDAWYAAFSVEQGDTLYLPPDDRVRLW